MNFQKKLTVRLIVAIVYMVLGVVLILTCCLTNVNTEVLSPLGAALLVIGAARVKQYVRITKSKASIREQEIKETDERNVYVINKAKSSAFNVYVPLASLAVIVLQLLGQVDAVRWVFGAVMALVILYWICYFVIHKRS